MSLQESLRKEKLNGEAKILVTLYSDVAKNYEPQLHLVKDWNFERHGYGDTLIRIKVDVNSYHNEKDIKKALNREYENRLKGLKVNVRNHDIEYNTDRNQIMVRISGNLVGD